MTAVPRLKPRPARGNPSDTRERIVLAAAKLFEEHGYFATDTNAIARAAGYSPGTFYKHFTDKAAVFVAAYEWWVAHVWSGIDDAHDDLAVAIRHVVSVHKKWAGFRRDLRHLASSDPAVRRAYLGERGKQIDRLVASGATRPAAALLLYATERTADAIADRERVGVTEDELVAELHTFAKTVLPRSPASS